MSLSDDVALLRDLKPWPDQLPPGLRLGLRLLLVGSPRGPAKIHLHTHTHLDPCRSSRIAEQQAKLDSRMR
eukprot:2878022-Alexandrium_andersonii.AAC.1